MPTFTIICIASSHASSSIVQLGSTKIDTCCSSDNSQSNKLNILKKAQKLALNELISFESLLEAMEIIWIQTLEDKAIVSMQEVLCDFVTSLSSTEQMTWQCFEKQQPRERVPNVASPMSLRLRYCVRKKHSETRFASSNMMIYPKISTHSGDIIKHLEFV